MLNFEKFGDDPRILTLPSKFAHFSLTYVSLKTFELREFDQHF